MHRPHHLLRSTAAIAVLVSKPNPPLFLPTPRRYTVPATSTMRTIITVVAVVPPVGSGHTLTVPEALIALTTHRLPPNSQEVPHPDGTSREHNITIKRSRSLAITIKIDHRKEGKVFNPRLPPPGDKFKPIKKAGFNMNDNDFPSL